jgi:hypothetical protein
VIPFFEAGNADQSAVEIVCPTVIRTRERGQVTLVGAADSVAAMPAATSVARCAAVVAAENDGSSPIVR